MKDLVVVPISFVSEHIETLEEIDIEYREIATEAGVTNFRRVPALDISPSFIMGLADLVQHSLAGPEVNLDQAAELSRTVKLYPQDKWAWGWNNSSEVWNGRLAMLGFSAFLLELISGQGHCMPWGCFRPAGPGADSPPGLLPGMRSNGSGWLRPWSRLLPWGLLLAAALAPSLAVPAQAEPAGAGVSSLW